MFNLPQSSLPIAVLIRDRCRDLALTPADLIRRTGYKNVSKGLRLLERLCTGTVSRCQGLIPLLPAALQVGDETLRHAIEDTQRQLKEAEEAAWRAAFKPHAVIIPERRIPQPIFAAAIVGVDNLLRIDFDLEAGPDTFVSQALGVIRKICGRDGLGTILAFGRPTGFAVNYAPDRAVLFDLEGNPVESFDHARRLGHASFSIGGRELTDGEMAAIFGRR